MGPHGVGKIDGQEKNITTYNLARMNMLLHWAKTTEFDIYHGDTLTNDSRLLRETNPAKMPKFDAIVGNPPFGDRWDSSEVQKPDDRMFINAGNFPRNLYLRPRNFIYFPLNLIYFPQNLIYFN